MILEPAAKQVLVLSFKKYLSDENIYIYIYIIQCLLVPVSSSAVQSIGICTFFIEYVHPFPSYAYVPMDPLSSCADYPFLFFFLLLVFTGPQAGNSSCSIFLPSPSIRPALLHQLQYMLIKPIFLQHIVFQILSAGDQAQTLPIWLFRCSMIFLSMSVQL